MIWMILSTRDITNPDMTVDNATHIYVHKLATSTDECSSPHSGIYILAAIYFTDTVTLYPISNSACVYITLSPVTC